MNILFHSNQIGERGTEVALFDYAVGNKNILKNNSFIAVPKERVFDTQALEKFKNNFKICLYSNQKEFENFVLKNDISLIYKIVHGKKETLPEIDVPFFIHCVYSTQSKYGTYYCPISEYINRWFRTKYPVLPHIVKKFPGISTTLKKELNIPNNAVVFGSYGGEDSFNISFVHQVICEVAKEQKDIFFIFMNIKSFINSNEEYKNILFLPKNTDLIYKERFINTCDAMIHAQSLGETFGLAVAEFSVKNKPVITYTPGLIHFVKEIRRYFLRKSNSYSMAHLEYLGKKAIKYSSKKSLKDIFLNFKRKYLKQINYDCYSNRFSEKSVMKIFSNIIQ
jgi:hypothetical protein